MMNLFLITVNYLGRRLASFKRIDILPRDKRNFCPSIDILSIVEPWHGFRHLGVTRNDVQANNPKARKAIELMGEVPKDILNMKVRSDYAPDLRQYESVESVEESQTELKSAGD